MAVTRQPVYSPPPAFTIHLFQIESADEIARSALSAWLSPRRTHQRISRPLQALVIHFSNGIGTTNQPLQLKEKASVYEEMNVFLSLYKSVPALPPICPRIVPASFFRHPQ
jgi:hypothetical protein